MAPRNKFTKEEIIEAALGLVRTQGIETLTARSLAQTLGTSTKPIFGLFESMQDLTQQVMVAGMGVYNDYIRRSMEDADIPPYKASGMGYIRFAREEPRLFKWLYMRNRTQEHTQEERDSIRPLLTLLQAQLGLDEDTAYRFHLEMWIYVHGIATMIATGYLNWDMNFVSEALTDVYRGLICRYREGT